MVIFVFFFQAEDGIRDAQESRGLGDVYKRQVDRSERSMEAAERAAPFVKEGSTVILFHAYRKPEPYLIAGPCISGVLVENEQYEKECIESDRIVNEVQTQARDRLFAACGFDLPKEKVHYVLYDAENPCLLYTSDAADEEDSVDLGGRRIIKKKTNE
eukprot:TRINITY_DN49464_c0_g1_i2.p1 TRINITY_DN49464_c0_g1~~TRINITY_DN49464_c0_g1_i2.p1  ORF type:complete len:158 (-),score=55.81 TRINITY_DN49464_c0_g1_i2:93-566(-)